jgi:DNA (cytosine-5)-methyltransferase 1
MANETDLCVAYCLQGNMIGRQDHNGPCGGGVSEELAYTVTATDVGGVAALFKRQRSDSYAENNVAGTQTANQCKGETDLVCENRLGVAAVDCRNYKELGEVSGTLRAKDAPGYSLNFQNPVHTGYIVRRLLPVECVRLQGYPDGWTEFGHDGKPISDTRRYQMLGNSVAVPCVAYILLGITEQFRKEDA